MSKTWTLILFVTMMVVQTLSLASEVYAVNVGDVHHDEVIELQHDLSSAVDHEQAAPSESGTVDHGSDCEACACTGSHCCHGSHLQLLNQAIPISPARSGHLALQYLAHPAPAYNANILRPPIA